MDSNSIRWIIKNKERYYLILGVSPSADEEEIRRAYRKKVLLLHPDKSPGEEAGEACRAINRAYEVLRERESRLRYDLMGEDELENQKASELILFGVKLVVAKMCLPFFRRRSGSRTEPSLRPWATLGVVQWSLLVLVLLALLLSSSSTYAERSLTAWISRSREPASVTFPVFWDCLAASMRPPNGTLESLLQCQRVREGEGLGKNASKMVMVRGKDRDETIGQFRARMARKCQHEALLRWSSLQRYEPTAQLRVPTPLPAYTSPNQVDPSVPRRYPAEEWQPSFAGTRYTILREEDLYPLSRECQLLEAVT